MRLPHFEKDLTDDISFTLPWWLLVGVWGLVTAGVWRWTRFKKAAEAFEVEAKRWARNSLDG